MATLTSSLAYANEESEQRLNVLFIAVDDLRPALGCYEDPIAITPNIDRLAAQGTVFRHAYCQQAVCSPSRLSLLTGLRPDTTRVWDLGTHFRAAVPDAITLPQHFKSHGYHTRSIGKIFHGNGKPSADPVSWSVPPQHDVLRDMNLKYASKRNRLSKGSKRSATEAPDVSDSTYIDGVVCEAAEQAIEELVSDDKPFFLAVGFRKPHLPFCAPQKYWDLYDRSKIPKPQPANHPAGAPELATRSWMELEGYSDIPNSGHLAAEQVQELRHGYYACVSYVDTLIGRLLARIQHHKLMQNTVIVLWGDHGFHLGEQGLWTKANNYELATRVPLIVAAPGRSRKGSVSNALVELVDIYPTLTEVCGLDSIENLEGTSFAPILSDPMRPWKPAVFHQYPRSYKSHRHRQHGDIMGYAVRTNRYRFVEWKNWKSGKTVARELYDLRVDLAESRNIVHERDQQTVVKTMANVLADGWRAAVPPAHSN